MPTVIKYWKEIFVGAAVIVALLYITITQARIEKMQREIRAAIQESQKPVSYPDGSASSSVDIMAREKALLEKAKEEFHADVIKELKKRDEKIQAIHSATVLLNGTVGSLVANDQDETHTGTWIFDDNRLNASVDPVEKKLDYFIKPRQIELTFLETSRVVDGVKDIRTYRLRAKDDLGLDLAVKDFQTEMLLPNCPKPKWYEKIPILKNRWGRVAVIGVGAVGITYLATRD